MEKTGLSWFIDHSSNGPGLMTRKGLFDFNGIDNEICFKCRDAVVFNEYKPPNVTTLIP
jgi:hypothetical protein